MMSTRFFILRLKKLSQALETANFMFFVRGFGLGVIALSIFAWYNEGVYSQLISNGFSWMFFIYFSFQFIVFSRLLEKNSIHGLRNIVYTVNLIAGLISLTDTIWIIINDHFVRNLFVNGFRLGWFVSPHMSRNIVLGFGLIVYYNLFKDRLMTPNRLFLVAVVCYTIFWIVYVLIGTPDWRQPATLTVLNQFEAFILWQFGFRAFASLVFTSPFIHKLS